MEKSLVHGHVTDMDLLLLLKLDPSLIIYGAFTLNVKSVLIDNLGGILGGTQCYMGNSLMLSEC